VRIEDRGSKIEDRKIEQPTPIFYSILDLRSSIFDPRSSLPLFSPFQEKQGG